MSFANRPRYRKPGPWPIAWAVIGCAAAAIIGSNSLSSFASGVVHGTHPLRAAPPRFRVPIPAGARAVCAEKSLLGAGPATPPAGAVAVPAGSNARLNFSQRHRTYWFAPGVHTLGGGAYSQILPGTGSRYIGAPGAVLDGMHKNDYAFGGYASDVTISFLTIQNFGQPGGNQNEGVVNHDAARGWTVSHSTITANAGAGVFVGTDNRIIFNCISNNQQYGLNAYSMSGTIANVLIAHNEITGNDTANWEARVPGCGCSGGGKLWDVDGAVIADNWIADNHSAGLWADTDNRDFEFRSNYIAGNYSYGIIYEISYNADIVGNTFARNGIGEGRKNPGFPTSAVYISESGSDSRVPGRYGASFQIANNAFVNNWGGVILWENANRFCGSPSNTSTGACTLVNPGTVRRSTCNPENIGKVPYVDDCRWKVKNVSVNNNTFDFNPAEVGLSCMPQNWCGFQGLFSEFGTFPAWSPYRAASVERAITFEQNNHFLDNTYNGPWQFMAEQQGNIVSWWNWRSDPYSQDKGSTLQSDA